jgi:hypothetical protein
MRRLSRPAQACKLCGEARQLVRSHLIASGFYELLRDRNPTATNQNPIVMSRKVSMHTSRQVADYVLCKECDQRLATYGEEWVLRHVNNGTRFPLFDRLNLAIPIGDLSGPEVQAFSGTAVGIDTQQLTYFALSVIWRAAVHKWHTSNTETIGISLGCYEEQIRRYLLGKAGFPNDVVVMATVCTDFASREGCYFPCAVKGSVHPAYAFLVRGVYLRVFIAPDLAPGFRGLCCFTSPQRLIFMRDCSKEALETWGTILRTSKPVGELAPVS